MYLVVATLTSFQPTVLACGTAREVTAVKSRMGCARLGEVDAGSDLMQIGYDERRRAAALSAIQCDPNSRRSVHYSAQMVRVVEQLRT
jgi:hypothetical protein